jgi:hypothetical protein
MKRTKNVLIAGIALAIGLCTSVQLFTMEPEKPFSNVDFNSLPTDVKGLIVMTLAESNNTDEAIANLKKISTVNKELYGIIDGILNNVSNIYGFINSMQMLVKSHNNLNEAITDINQKSEVNQELRNVINDMHGFTTLMHILENKFTIYTTEEIAQKFNTPIAQKYINLGNKLLSTMILPYSEFFVAKVTELINAGADINFSAIRMSRTSVLQKAVNSEEPQKVTLILEFGAKPDQTLTSMLKLHRTTEKWKNIMSILENAIEKNNNLPKIGQL